MRKLLLVESDYQRNKNAFIQTSQLLSEIDELLSKQLPQPYMSAEAVKEYLGWLDELEKRNYADLNSVIRANQWRDAFSEPRPSNIWGEINPNTYLASVKSRLGSYRSEIQSQNDSAKHKMEELEAQILTLQYSKDSVRLTKWNILFSILVPIIILLVSVLIESLKPELITGIRVFLHLPSLKP